MRGHAQLRDLLHLERDVAVDDVVGEDAAGGQELAVLIQFVQRLIQRIADLRDGLLLFRRQVVEVLVHGIARVDLVLDAVEAGHHHGRERQVRVAHGVREANLDASRLRVCVMRDTDRRGAVAAE
jgi:hypothetical protein